MSETILRDFQLYSQVTAEKKLVGSALPRIDGRERVSGVARYAGDWKVSGMLYARIIESTHYHALVKKIDTSKARNVAGVEAIITCFDDDTTWGEGERKHKRKVFTDRVRFVGDCIGAIAAKSRIVALEAVDSILVDYEDLPGVFNIQDSLKPDAPRIWEDGNVIGPFKYGYGNVDEAFKNGDMIIEREYFTSRVHNSPLEPAISLAWWDEGKLTVVAATQGLYACQEGLAHDLGLSLKDVRVVCYYKGGGFGSKNSVMNYDLIAALLARKTRKPVMVEYSREQEFSAVHGRWSTSQHLRAGVNKRNSRIIAMDFKGYADVGAYSRHIYYPAYQTAFARFVDGAEKYYACEAWRAEVYGVYTNSPVTANMRSPTGPQACFAAETLADELAYELDLNPLEFRLRNAAGTHRGLTGFLSSSMEECLRVGAEKFDWDRKWRGPSEKNLARSPGRSGVGLAMANLHAFVGPGNAVLKFNKNGILEVYVGVIDVGTGAKSAMVAIAADALGLKIQDVKLIWGDSEKCPYSIGESASRTTTFTGTAVRSAAMKIRQKILTMAENYLKSRIEELDIVGGMIFDRRADASSRISVAELLQSLGHDSITQEEKSAPTLPEHKERFSFTAHFAEVSVDEETGNVSVEKYLVAQESGEIINRLTSESQVQGSVVMGIGMALTEKLLIDQDNGSVQNPNFLTYRLPNILDVPRIEVLFLDSNDGFGPKSLGEISIIPVAAAIGNAIFNATGKRLRKTPFLPEDVISARSELRTIL